ncbi:MAG: M56 family metallopeptidase [Lachnospiraceae bacterium]|nr:M56 family metallopeptidase [Lachnospiraceae bacterium]
MNCHFMIWLLCITFLRFLFPGEFKYSISIRISHTFQEIMIFVYRHPISILGYSIYIYQILLVVWLSVAFILLMRIIRKYMRFHSSVKQLLHSHQTASIEKPQDCDFPKSVQLYESSLISAPLITGLFKPVIIMPVLSLSPQELSFVVRHELQHYKYRDLLLKLFMELFCILYWWNPVMHLLKKQLLLLLEMRADTEVYEPLSNTEKIDYLGCLKKLFSCQSKDSLF